MLYCFLPSHWSLSSYQHQGTISALKDWQRLVNRGSPQCSSTLFQQDHTFGTSKPVVSPEEKTLRKFEINVFDFSVCYLYWEQLLSLTYPWWKKTGVRPQGLVCHLWKSTKKLSASYNVSPALSPQAHTSLVLHRGTSYFPDFLPSWVQSEDIYLEIFTRSLFFTSAWRLRQLISENGRTYSSHLQDKKRTK